jgi:hypothetical protein
MFLRNVYRNTRQHIPEDIVRSFRCEDFISIILYAFVSRIRLSLLIFSGVSRAVTISVVHCADVALV